MSYFITALSCAFVFGIVVGVMIESSARKYFLKEYKRMTGEEDEKR